MWTEPIRITKLTHSTGSRALSPDPQSPHPPQTISQKDFDQLQTKISYQNTIPAASAHGSISALTASNSLPAEGSTDAPRTPEATSQAPWTQTEADSRHELCLRRSQECLADKEPTQVRRPQSQNPKPIIKLLARAQPPSRLGHSHPAPNPSPASHLTLHSCVLPS